MSVTLERPNTLKAMREAAGLSTREAARRLAEVLQKEHRTHAWVIKIEREGTNLDDVTEALAEVYSIPVEDIRQASRQLRQTGNNFSPNG